MWKSCWSCALFLASVVLQAQVSFRRPEVGDLERNKAATVLVLEDVEANIHSYSSQGNPKDIFPGPPRSGRSLVFPAFTEEGASSTSIAIDEPDTIDPVGNSDYSSYSLPDNYYFKYTLSPVVESQKALIYQRLDRLQRTPLYGLYAVIPREEMYRSEGPYGIETQFYIQMHHLKAEDLPSQKLRPVLRARFSRELKLEGGELNKEGIFSGSDAQIAFPKPWMAQLAAEKIKRIWVECGVRVDRTGIPVNPALRQVRPIALETNKNLYLVSQSAAAVGVKHGYFVPMSKYAVFRFTSNVPVTAEKVRLLLNTYHTNLKQAFESNPLGAQEGPPGDNFPGEFHFLKHREKSTVLTGFAGPYKELSDYFVKWLRIDDGELYTLLPVHRVGSELLDRIL